MGTSYIFTRGGLSVVINGRPYSVEQSHPNYNSIIEALRNRQFDLIPDMIDRATAVQKYLDADQENKDVKIDAKDGIVTYKGEEVHNAICEQILKMMNDGFPVTPLVCLLSNLMENPSKKAVDELYRWMTANGITMTEDGYILAYKRVKTDWTSFYDGKTLHTVGEWVEMPRNAVDDRSDVTCSNGLHFCSYNYLPSYYGGEGRVIVLKIHPKDVVSIPTDYNNAKGRACRYFVLEELKDSVREAVETKDVLPQPVVTAATDINKSETYKDGYSSGYKDGRGKQKRKVHEGDVFDYDKDYDTFEAGYCDGYRDGRLKNPKLY